MASPKRGPKRGVGKNRARVSKGQPTQPTNQFDYPALSFAQRTGKAPKIVLFHAPVEDVLVWAEIDALGPRTVGPQRERREAKVSAISKYMSIDKRNIIPTAVVVAFYERTAAFASSQPHGMGKLAVNASKGPAASVVDGQHRLFGLQEYNGKTEVAIVGLLDTDEAEQAFQFLVINNKASRVAARHTKALIAKMESTDLSERLRAARVALGVDGVKDVDLVNTDKESPFYKTIDWPTTPEPKRMVQATAIEASLDYLGGLGLADFEDRDVRRTVFLVMWARIKAEWLDLWAPSSKLISKVGIVCLTRFIADRLASWSDSDEIEIDLTDLAQIEKYTGRIVGYMNRLFWEAPWAEKASGGFDTTQGRERVLGAIRQLYRNGKNEVDWYTDIDIIDPSAIPNNNK